MIRRIGFIVLGILIIIAPIAGLPGGARDVVVQLLGVGVLVFTLLVPRSEKKKKEVVRVERTDVPEVYPEERHE